MTGTALAQALAPHALADLGAVHEGDGTLVLIGPDGPGFWDVFQASPEAQDGQPHPLDRWSQRILGGIARDLGASALFPFGGPPWHPFPTWAVRSGWCHTSPVVLLVHATAGLWVSFRGALLFPGHLPLPDPPQNPCDSCEEQPCRTACPISALRPGHYDTDLCHGFLDTTAGRDCMDCGCAVRRACPVSQAHGRNTEQSAFHMDAFHK